MFENAVNLKWRSVQRKKSHLLSTNINLNNIIKIEFTPLFHIISKSCTKHGPSNVGRVTSFVDDTELEVNKNEKSDK